MRWNRSTSEGCRRVLEALESRRSHENLERIEKQTQLEIAMLLWRNLVAALRLERSGVTPWGFESL